MEIQFNRMLAAVDAFLNSCQAVLKIELAPDDSCFQEVQLPRIVIEDETSVLWITLQIRCERLQALPQGRRLEQKAITALLGLDLEAQRVSKLIRREGRHGFALGHDAEGLTQERVGSGFGLGGVEHRRRGFPDDQVDLDIVQAVDGRRQTVQRCCDVHPSTDLPGGLNDVEAFHPELRFDRGALDLLGYGLQIGLTDALVKQHDGGDPFAFQPGDCLLVDPA